MNPNSLPAASQAAAEAALRDQPYMRATCTLIDTTRTRAADRLAAIGIATPASFANFLLLNFETPEQAQHANAALQANGIFLRPQSGAGLPHCLAHDHRSAGSCRHRPHSAGRHGCRRSVHDQLTPSRGRARIGVLVPFTNTNLEPDMAMMTPPGVSLHFARMGGYDEDAIPDAAQMQSLGAADLQDDTLDAAVGGETWRGSLWLHVRHAQPWTGLRPRPCHPYQGAKRCADRHRRRCPGPCACAHWGHREDRLRLALCSGDQRPRDRLLDQDGNRDRRAR
jgi:hypothetical protein